MNITEAIKERRTVRKFKSDHIPIETLKEILSLSTWAPNHGLREPWRFILYYADGRKKFIDAQVGAYEKSPYASLMKDENEREMLKKKNIEYLMGIPAHLVVLMPEDPRQKQWEEDFAAVGALIQNIQLAAWEKGIGVVWKTNSYIYEPSFYEAIGAKPGEKVVAVLHLGIPETIPEPHPRTALEEKLIVVDK